MNSYDKLCYSSHTTLPIIAIYVYLGSSAFWINMRLVWPKTFYLFKILGLKIMKISIMFQGVTAKYPMRRRTRMILKRENQISVWLKVCLTGNLKLKWETVCSKLSITSNKNWRKTIDSGLSLGRITVLFRFISNQCCDLIVGICLFLVTWQWYFSPSPESDLSQNSIHLPKFILWNKASFVLSLRCKSHQHILWLYVLMIHYL